MNEENGSKHQRSASVDESQVGDRVVLYDRVSRKALVLNPTGTLLWHLLATPLTLQELTVKLQSTFSSLTAQQAMDDASAFLQTLRDHGVLLSSET